jgi:hypothetical protein
VGIKANERPVNSLSLVNIAGISAIQYTLNFQAAGVSCGNVAASLRRLSKITVATSSNVISERQFLPSHVADSTCTLAGFNRHPEHLRRIVKQVQRLSLSSPCRRSIFVNFLQLRPWEITLPPERDLRCLYSRRSLWKTPFNMMKPG